MADVELAVLGYVVWFIEHRLDGEITSGASNTIPAEFEVAYHR